MEQQPYQNPQAFMRPYRGTGFATASLVCSVMSVMSCMIFYVTFFFGSMSILFALLSRQDSLKMPTISKIGFAVSVIGILLTSILTISSVLFLLETFGLEMILNHPEQILEELLHTMEELTQMGGVVSEPSL